MAETKLWLEISVSILYKFYQQMCFLDPLRGTFSAVVLSWEHKKEKGNISTHKSESKYRMLKNAPIVMHVMERKMKGNIWQTDDVT